MNDGRGRLSAKRFGRTRIVTPADCSFLNKLLKNVICPLPHGRGSDWRADLAALAEPCALASGPLHQFFNNLFQCDRSKI